MKTMIVSVRDSALSGFSAPMAYPTTAVAFRQFSQQVNSGDQSSQLVLHPQDFELWHLAVFDDEAGVFEAPEGGVRCLARGQDVKQTT